VEELITGIALYQAETAILDITGVRVLDTQVADELVRIACAGCHEHAAHGAQLPDGDRPGTSWRDVIRGTLKEE
jgi:hypothetical protein